ncbi:SLATT domain-containing protein [Pseudoalteromonas piscicida]|uniref:SLATT domain-containing protein n=1 Tax=Pseudoalteromonas piscicida TaxID=43662 RepID=UPI0005F9F002|nr:SLATT domain-containing protein [Pseudoalteromonas piscicida]
MKTRLDLLKEWYERASVTQAAHYYSAGNFGTRKYYLGVPSVILTTLVGTSVFAALQNTPAIWLQILMGLASVTAALLSALQTFLGDAERSEKHRIAAAKYGALGRELECYLSNGGTVSDEQLADLLKSLNTLANESPSIPLKIYRKAGATELQLPCIA